MQREDLEGTTTFIPMGEQKEVEESRIRRACQPYPQRTAEQREDAEESTILTSMGNLREDLKGIETSTPMGEQREDPEATQPHPHREVGSGIEALPGR